MLIRKMFRFENSHIVRNCSTLKCRSSIHGHSYKVEVIIEANSLDNGEMVYDFSLIKNSIFDFIDSFDHSICIWDKDNEEYIKFVKKHSQRWILLKLNPSAEQLSRIFFVFIDNILKLSIKINKEGDIKLKSIIMHETDSGYAQCFRDDAYNEKMGKIKLKDLIFSKAIMDSWKNKDFFDRIKSKKVFINPDTI